MVIIGFYLLTVVMTGSVLFMINRVSAASRQAKRKASIFFILGISMWLVYVISLSTTGVLGSFGLPPRVPLFIVLPAIVLVFFYTSRREMKEVIHATSKSFPVYIQFFRVVVELLIYGTFLNNIFPRSVTFEGTNFDILVGLSAPVISYFHYKNKVSDKGLLAWNIVSLSILAVTVYTFVFSFYFTKHAPNIDLYKFVKPPYILLASVLLPHAILYHVISIKQLIGSKQPASSNASANAGSGS